MGTVYLVGAGPGDPELLTVRGHRLLKGADAVVYDALVNRELLELVPTSAERFDVGRRKGEKRIDQEQLNGLLIHLAGSRDGVVRLKGGDPFVFGRGGEEALALTDAGVDYEVVPGVTSGIGALAYAGIPLTHRGLASSATFLTGHQVLREPGDSPTPSTGSLGRPDGTLVVFMGLSRLDEVATELVRGGWNPGTPAAIIEWGTYRRQRTVVGTLLTLPARARAAGISRPALAVVGEVVRLRRRIRWFPEDPEAERSSPEVAAEPEEASGMDWTLFTDTEGVRSHAPAPTNRVLAVGVDTGERLRELGHEPDLTLRSGHPVAVVTAMRALGPVEGHTVTIVQGKPGQEELVQLLRTLGARPLRLAYGGVTSKWV